MAARTGEQFLRGLKDDRAVWVDGERVRDVAGHPAFEGGARMMAELFDLQHAERETCLMPDPETGEPIGASHMIPRSRADLERRRLCLERIAEHTVGLMGRSPDYMNVTFAGFAGRDDEWGAFGNEAGAANLVEFQRELRRRDLSLTHTIIHPTVDKSLPDVRAGGGEVAHASWRRSRRSPTRSRSTRATRSPRTGTATPSRSPFRSPPRGSSSSAATAPRAARAPTTTRSPAASTSRTPSSSTTTSRCRASACSSTATSTSTTR